ncbi:hypothetical protein SPHV1_2430019 [Novosphingobium sp. KN65.2]|nr:hypothetical protein SPHV1_2430019 [Novosphingobium sp. KN65.2]
MSCPGWHSAATQHRNIGCALEPSLSDPSLQGDAAARSNRVGWAPHKITVRPSTARDA